jgi:hypothetical protein
MTCRFEKKAAFAGILPTGRLFLRGIQYCDLRIQYISHGHEIRVKAQKEYLSKTIQVPVWHIIRVAYIIYFA